MDSTSLTFLGFLALVGTLAWFWVMPSMAGWEPGAVGIGIVVLFGSAALATQISPGSALSQKLAALAQLSLLLAVAIPCAISPGLRIITAATVPAVVLVLFSLIRPQRLERWRWWKAYVFVSTTIAGILLIVFALFVAAVLFGTHG